MILRLRSVTLYLLFFTGTGAAEAAPRSYQGGALRMPLPWHAQNHYGLRRAQTPGQLNYTSPLIRKIQAISNKVFLLWIV
jgi:hypothetical protein